MSVIPAAHVTPPSPSFVIGTAGHIDHGKSALVRALTGIDPDRLEEEKRRGMTIDLGFAHLDLPGGRRIGIVDVPGHERLIKNMLAGAGGVDLVLLVVAADEGVMAQTREHLDILRFLRIKRGIIVLSKIDVVQDSDWPALVEEEISRLVAGTFLEGAPVVRCSAKTGEGLATLITTIEQQLEGLAPHSTDGPARLPIDRVFTMPGFGTVVTGTLWSGSIRLGETLEILPRSGRARVRQLQRHGGRVDEVTAGSRAAVNLAGVEREELTRGMVLATPGTIRPAILIDARVRLLPSAPPVKHLARLRLYLGTDETFCRIALLDRDRLEPEAEGLAQLRLERPLVAVRGDPFVLRRYSPLATLGGGEVISVNPPKRRRGQAETAAVSALAQTDLAGLILRAAAERGLAGTTVEAVAPLVGQRLELVAAEVKRLAAEGSLRSVRDRLFSAEAADRAAARVVEAVEESHRLHPWRLGMPREEVKSRIFPEADDRLVSVLLEDLRLQGRVAVTRGMLHRPGREPSYTPAERAQREEILKAIAGARFSPPPPAEAAARVGDGPGFQRMVESLQDEGTLVEVAPGVLFAADVLDEVRRTVVAQIESAGEITVASLRDALGTSRKYALALLEYFDGIRLTRRVGDRRVLAAPHPRGAGA